MNPDAEARAILSEFEDARRMAVARFCQSYKSMPAEDAVALCNERLLVYAGLLPTSHPSGRDCDAGKLAAWRKQAEGKSVPWLYLRGIVARALRADLMDATRTTHRAPPVTASLEWLSENVPAFDIAAEGIQDEWDIYYAGFPMLSARYRDGMTIQEMARRFGKRKENIVIAIEQEKESVRLGLCS